MHARSRRLLRAHVNSRAYIVHIYDYVDIPCIERNSFITAIPQMNPVGSGMTVAKVPSNQGVLGQGVLCLLCSYNNLRGEFGRISLIIITKEPM